MCKDRNILLCLRHLHKFSLGSKWKANITSENRQITEQWTGRTRRRQTKRITSVSQQQQRQVTPGCVRVESVKWNAQIGPGKKGKAAALSRSQPQVEWENPTRSIFFFSSAHFVVVAALTWPKLITFLSLFYSYAMPSTVPRTRTSTASTKASIPRLARISTWPSPSVNNGATSWSRSRQQLQQWMSLHRVALTRSTTAWRTFCNENSSHNPRNVSDCSRSRRRSPQATTMRCVNPLKTPKCLGLH